MKSHKRYRLGALIAGLTALLAAVIGAVSTGSASAALTGNCFIVVDGKVHVNPACFTTTAAASPTYMTVNVRAHANGLFVTADNAGASPLINNRWGVGGWEGFGLYMWSNGTVRLRSLANTGSAIYVSAATGTLIANVTSPGSWETFTLVRNSDSSISLRAADGRLVVADPAGSQPLVTGPTAVTPEAEFDLLPTPAPLGTFTLRQHDTGRYVTTGSDGSLSTTPTFTGDAERFVEFQMPNGGVAFRSVANQQYVTAENAGGSPLIANRPGIGTWETFTLTRQSNGAYTLTAVNTLLVDGTTSLIANASAPNGTDTFDLANA